MVEYWACCACIYKAPMSGVTTSSHEQVFGHSSLHVVQTLCRLWIMRSRICPVQADSNKFGEPNFHHWLQLISNVQWQTWDPRTKTCRILWTPVQTLDKNSEASACVQEGWILLLAQKFENNKGKNCHSKDPAEPYLYRC